MKFSSWNTATPMTPPSPQLPTQQAPALGEKSSHGQAAPGSEQRDRAVDIPAHCKDLD